MYVDHALERCVSSLVAGPPARRGDRAGADRKAPPRCRCGGGALWNPRERVADPRGLAGEEHHAAWGEHALEFGERCREVGKVVQHCMAEYEIEALIGERQALGVHADRTYGERKPPGVGLKRGEHTF